MVYGINRVGALAEIVVVSVVTAGMRPAAGMRPGVLTVTLGSDKRASSSRSCLTSEWICPVFSVEWVLQIAATELGSGDLHDLVS